MCTRPDTGHEATQRVEVADILRHPWPRLPATASPVGRPAPGDGGHHSLSDRGVRGPADAV